MNTVKENQTTDVRSILFNRIMYGALIAIGLLMLILKNDVPSAMSNFGIALVFDPFDQKVSWAERPFFQRAWLIVHLGIVFCLMGYLFFSWL